MYCFVAALILVSTATNTVTIVTAEPLKFEIRHLKTAAIGQPPLWRRVPRSLDEFPVELDKTVIDPWNYHDRLGMLKILVRKTRTDFVDVFVPGSGANMANLLWGLALQHGWQFSTLRLRDVSNSSFCSLKTVYHELCISPKSWWATMNYYLSVLPFLGAQEAGYFTSWPLPINVLYPSINRHLFCVDNTTCNAKEGVGQALADWRDFFTVLKRRPRAPKDLITAHMWHAHVASFEAALPLADSLIGILAKPEQRFGRDWVHFVHYLADAYYKTYLNSTYKFQVSI